MQTSRMSEDGHASRHVVASYGAYPEAQKAVDRLSDEGFPVERSSIVGEDLKLVEQVTGRVGYGRAILGGAGNGALTAAFFGLIFGLFSPALGLTLALWGFVFGAAFGAAFGAIGHALSGGERDFSSINAMVAGRYDVVVDDEVADEATRIISGTGTRATT